MGRVVSLFLPQLAVERLRRSVRSPALRPEPGVLITPVDDDPGTCSVPRDGSWRPGARWAGHPARGDVQRRFDEMPAHARPPTRELGRRSEAAHHPFRRATETTVGSSRLGPDAAGSPLRALALVAKVGRREEVVASCPAAMALGIVLGMAATHARALVADIDLRPAEPEADAALLDRLALLAVRRWSPTAAVTPPDGIWLDLAGCAHLHGGEQRFCRRLTALCARVGLTARIAVADTPGAAHALARFGTTPGTTVVIAPTGTTVAALVPLPIVALRLDPIALGAARRFGFDTIGDLVPVARGPLARRLGMDAVTRLDQALGSAAEPITPILDEVAPAVERHLLEPIGTAEAIVQVMSDLLADLAGLLAGCGCGARALRLVCHRVDGGEQVVAVGTSRPTRDASHLLRLFRLRIERIDPGMGLERFVMTAVHVEPLDSAAIGTMLAGDSVTTDPARLIDVVAGRVGASAVFRLAPVASHVPEREVARVDPLAVPGGWPIWRRPVRLLSRPEPLFRVVALLPDHPPRRFEWRGRLHDVAAGDGPERIHGEWWRREAEVWAVRDYYRVEDGDGGRYWVFRRGDGVASDTGDLTWWMHGLFA